MGARADTGWARRGAVASGGLVGTGLRMASAAIVPAGPGRLPLATLAVNLVGALLLGVALRRVRPKGWTRLSSFVCTGLLGALTTFSTFVVEVVALADTAPRTSVARDEVIAIVRRRMRRPTLRAVAMVNLSGAFAAGVVVGVALHGPPRAVLATGLLGGYTTYSTWMSEVAMSSRRRELANLLLQAASGILLTAVGVRLGVLLS